MLIEAGDLALRHFKSAVRSWTKRDRSPVSEADLAVNALLHRRLRALVPEAAWLSEESEDDRARLAARRVWVVDPIDGTRAYIAGHSDWSISVALVEDGRPIVAALLAPAERAHFLAKAAAGATINGAPMRIADAAGISGLRVAGPRFLLDRLGCILEGMQPRPKVHSLALRLARVASSDLDAAFASDASRDWDLAAADLLVHEAGGALTSLDGNPPCYNREHPVHQPLLAAGPGRHERIVALVRAQMPEFLPR